MRDDQAKAIVDLNTDPTIRTATTSAPIRWETRRMPDAVRAAALANAVDLLAHDPGVMVDARTDPADFVINLARKFETYLAPGEEAHGTPNH